MFNRAVIVNENFMQRVQNEQLPLLTSLNSYQSLGLSPEKLIEFFESQVLSRQLDLVSRDLKDKGLSFYTIGSSGHEGNVVAGDIFRLDDMAFLHYRSGAFFIQRSKQLSGSTVLYDLLLSFLASSEDPISGGRHKVFGSVPLNIPPQTSTIASHLPKALGAAISIDKARRLAVNSNLKDDSIILCSFGDASANHSTAQGAFNATQWTAYRSIPCPIIFICEDNGIGISVSTPNDWISASFKNRPCLHYIQGNSLNLLDSYAAYKEAEIYCRKTRKPVFLHMKTVRIMGHAGSDMETEYHSIKRIEENEAQDPLLVTASILLREKILSSEQILEIYNSTYQQVVQTCKIVLERPKLTSAEAVCESIIPEKHADIPCENAMSRDELFGRNFKNLDKPKNLQQSINTTLFDILNQRKNVLLFGEDVAKKGGVYNVSNGLFEKFGGQRVFNTLLDEQTILGLAIGFAHNGFIPIPEIQFLAYYHNAEDQIRGEASTLSFFSKSKLSNPMIIRIAGLAYQKGFGGHFHNDNSLAALRDIPGVILMLPSNGRSAVKLLRKAVMMAQVERRIIFFVEPIALYMTKDLHESNDNLWCHIYPDLSETSNFLEVETFGEGKDIAIVSYGNGYYLSRQAEKILRENHGINSKIIDIQWLCPLPIEPLIHELKGYKHLLIVDECRKTGSPSEEIMTRLYEEMPNRPKMHRLTGHDTFIPLGNAWKFVLPDKERIVEYVCNILK